MRHVEGMMAECHDKDERARIRDLADVHVHRVKDAARTLGRTLHEAAEAGHRSGYFAGFVDGKEESQALMRALQTELDRVMGLLGELRAVVRGECPSLLNEDSGGDAELDCNIDNAIQSWRARQGKEPKP